MQKLLCTPEQHKNHFPLPFPRPLYRGTVEPGLAGRWWNSCNGEWALGPGSGCKFNQTTSIPTSVLPAGGVKQHALNYVVSIAPLGTSHLFPVSPEEPGRPYKYSEASFCRNVSSRRRSSSDYWLVLSIAVFKMLFKPVSGCVWSPSHGCGLSQLESLPLESLHFLQLWLDSQDLGPHHQVGPAGSWHGWGGPAWHASCICRHCLYLSLSFPLRCCYC